MLEVLTPTPLCLPLYSFERFCKYEIDPILGRVRDCISDEHYIPTLFAAMGLEAEMACDSWGVAAMDWGSGGAHPRSYPPDQITPELFHRIRSTPGVPKSQETAAAQFVPCAALADPARACGDVLAGAPPPPYAAMLGEPKLTARKFPEESAAAVVEVFADCAGGLGMLGMLGAL